jgi:hypothetical protein
MLQPAAAGQQVVGDIQDVVALVIGQVPLEQVEAPVDVIDQAELPGQEMDGPDASGCDGPGPLGDLVVDIGGGVIDKRVDQRACLPATAFSAHPSRRIAE